MNEEALKIATDLIAQFEGCNLVSYPDPASPLYKELSKRNLLRLYMQGKVAIPEDIKNLSAGAVTIGYGETQGVKLGDVWTQEQATSRLSARVAQFMQGVLKSSPSLATGSPNRLAACTSLSYNVGLGNYASSTVAKKIAVKDWEGAASAFSLWDKAQGVVMVGLVSRREIESAVFMSKD